MTYAKNADLPESVTGAIASQAGQTMFRRVVNSQLRNGKSESVAFASAWSALTNAGYEKVGGKWVKKDLTPSSVHVPSTRWRKPKDMAKAYGAKPVYGFRPVLNAEEICMWARDSGFTKSLMPDEMHVTVLYSKRGFSPELSMRADEPPEWDNIDMYGNIVVRGGDRSLKKLGDKGAVVLRFDDERLHNEWDFYRALGASWDFPEYLAHVTLTYDGAPENVEALAAYPGDIILGPTRYRPIKTQFDPASIEHMDLNEGLLEYMTKRDSFTLPEEARARSETMGLGGSYHVHEVDGHGMYMPGATREDYVKALGYGQETDELPTDPEEYSSAFRTFIDTMASFLMGKKLDKKPVTDPSLIPDQYFEDPIIKVDDEKRIVWGWASVATVDNEPVVDLHGDIITAQEITSAADEFMMYKRTAKAMHEGAGIGFVLHSFPYTHELGKALGFTSNREGWVIAMKVLDEDHWRRVKSGEFKGFSIGGKGHRIALDS
jgi:cation transport regulator ChaB